MMCDFIVAAENAVFASEDQRGGMSGFAEMRKPEFKHR
jgi:hypothetical protein